MLYWVEAEDGTTNHVRNPAPEQIAKDFRVTSTFDVTNKASIDLMKNSLLYDRLEYT